MGFAERLAELMAERGISGRELARRLPCDRSYISLLTQGKRRPSPEMGAKIDDLLGAGGELAALAAPHAPEAAQPTTTARRPASCWAGFGRTWTTPGGCSTGAAAWLSTAASWSAAAGCRCSPLPA
jgi:transcriptional regulator with XRE-family HTH domain